MSVELGSGQLIPGFEDQLVGAKAGDEREVKVTFPDDYPAENLAGQGGDVRGHGQGGEDGGETKVDDEFAKSLGPREPRPAQGPDPRPAASRSSTA